ncbi:tetratricopeptide repeat protein [Marinilabiliaceae bacterium ANBcel2]|nr:tetratricopeptide repeat protein [Marinilabiliaceae bacterium ANBcel2]
MQEPEYSNYNRMKKEIERFELMEKGEHSFYFDVHTIENIFNFYSEKLQFDKAEKILSIGMQQHPQATSLYSKKAILLMEKGEDKKAIHLMENLTKFDKSNTEVFLNLGLIYLRNKRVKDAQNCFDQALDTTPSEKENILLDLSSALNLSLNYSLSVKYLEKFYKEFPGNENILFELAYAYDRAFQTNKSIKVYNHLLDLNPYSENAWYNLGIIYNKTGETKKAIDCYNYTLTINPGHAEALINKGNASIILEKIEEALDCYFEYIAYGHDPTFVYHYIADCYVLNENDEKARAFFDLAVKVGEDFIDVWLGYISFLIKIDDSKAAVNIAEKALEIHDEWDTGELTYLKARALLIDGKLYRANKAFEKCIEMDEDNLKFFFDACQVKIAANPESEKDDIIYEWLENYPDSSAVNYLAAAYYLIDSRNLTIAIKYLDKALSKDKYSFDFFLELFPSIERMIKKSKKLDRLVYSYFS